MGNKKKRGDFLRFMLAYHLVLFITLLLVSFSVLSLLKKQQRHRMETEVDLTLERQENFWKQQISVVRAFNAKCKYDKKYNELYTDIPGVYLEIKEELEGQEANFPFVEGIDIYDEKKEIVLTSQGVTTSELFFQKLCQTEIKKIKGNRDFVIKATKAKLHSQEGIVLSTPITTWSKEGQGFKYILYRISQRNLEEQFGTSEEMGSILLYKNEILFTSDILKDDMEESKGWQQNIKEAEKSETKNIQNRYYIYKKDLGDDFAMLCLVEKANLTRGLKIYLKIYSLWLLASLTLGIILTYVFSGNRYRNYRRVLDYSQELEEERKVLLEENCLYSLLTKEIVREDKLWNRCLKNGIALDKKWKFFLVLDKEAKKADYVYEQIQESFALEGISKIYALDATKTVRVYLVCSDEEAKEIDKKLRILISKDKWIGIGNTVKDVENLRQSYREAKSQYDRFHTREGEYPQNELLSLKTALEMEDVTKSIFLLQELSEYIREASEMGIYGIMWDVGRLFEKKAEKILEWQSVDRQDLVGQGLKFLESLKEEVIQKKKAKEKQADKKASLTYKKRNIVDVLRYVHDNYLEDNFSVKFMAAHFETSVSNISHFFKKNMDISISQYIEQLKLEKAQDLL
ncbi:MAG TPA: hypothetical protein VIR32_07395, partial [Lachnospiraceae bacterium]